jgi:hypothetical protein
MDSTSAARAEEWPSLSADERSAILEALSTDFEPDEPFPLPPGLPERPLTAGEWQYVAEMLQFRASFAEPDEEPRACEYAPGTPEKVRALRRRFRLGLSLFCARDAQLPASQRTAAGSYRAIAKLADAAREASRRVASARGKACSAAARRNGNGVAE